MSYCVVKSVFGDIWIGKSKKETDDIKFFATFDEASDRAKGKFLEFNLDFDENLDSNDEELQEAYDGLDDESNIEEVEEDMEKFII